MKQISRIIYTLFFYFVQSIEFCPLCYNEGQGIRTTYQAGHEPNKITLSLTNVVAVWHVTCTTRA
jgi:hypothetical protein